MAVTMYLVVVTIGVGFSKYQYMMFEINQRIFSASQVTLNHLDYHGPHFVRIAL